MKFLPAESREQNSLTQRHQQGMSQRVGFILARVGLALTLLCLFVVLLVVTTATVWLMTDVDGNLTQSMSVFTILSSHSWLVLSAGFACAALVVWLCSFAWHRGSFLDGAHGRRVLVQAALVFQLLLVVVLHTRGTSWGDSWMVNDMVKRAVANGIPSIFEGPYSTLFYDARLYFACYPFQATFFWILYGLRLISGDASFALLQVLSAFSNALGVVCLLDLGRMLTPSLRTQRVLWVLTAFSFPLYLLSTFLYLNALGFGVAMAFLAMQGRAMCGYALNVVGRDGALTQRVAHTPWQRFVKYADVHPWVWGVGSCIPLICALCVKETYILFAIAAVLAWIVVGLVYHRIRGLLLCLAVVLGARIISGLPFEALRSASGNYEFGEPLTTLNHLELGLRMGQGEFYVRADGGESTFAPGGWSNHANDLWATSGENARIQNEAASQFLAQDVAIFMAHPSYTLWFFRLKLQTEWADPTYQSLYYLSKSLSPTGARVANPADLRTPIGLLSTLATFILDGHQTVVFAGAYAFIASSWRAARRTRRHRPRRMMHSLRPKQDADTHVPVVIGKSRDVSFASHPAAVLNPCTILLAATFFVGFGCYLLWEAKAVYVLPFALVILPLAAAGLSRVFVIQARRRIHRKKLAH